MTFPDTPLHRLVLKLLKVSKPETLNTSDVIYDIECYPNIFTIVIYSPRKGEYFTFEISERRNDMARIEKVILNLRRDKRRMVGYNNLGYDYPVIHALVNYYRENRKYARGGR